MALFTETGTLYFYLNIEGWKGVNVGAVTDNLGKWTHVVATWQSGGRIKMYVNGTTVHQSDVVDGTYYGYDIKLGFGARENYGNFFTGVIDEVAIWNIQLSGADARYIYNSGNGRVVAPPAGTIIIIK